MQTPSVKDRKVINRKNNDIVTNIVVKNQTELLFLIFGFFVLGNIFVINFLLKENYIYFWDIAGFWLSSIDFSRVLFTHPIEGLLQLYSSILHMDYNLLPVVPLLVVVKCFSASHKIYTLAVYNLYLMPFIAVTLLFYRNLLQKLGEYSFKKMLLAVFMLLTYTALLTPVLFGYLDAVGLPIIALLVLITYKTNFEQHSLKNIVVIALLMVLLSILRRWYSYWVVSYFVSHFVVCFIKRIREKELKKLIKDTLYLFLIGVSYLAVLFIFFRGYLKRSIFNNFRDAYQAYNGGDAWFNLTNFIGFFSIVFISLVLIGIIILVIKEKTRYVSLFLIFQSLIMYILFTRIQSFGSQHIYLFITSFMFFAYFGLSSLMDLIKYKALKVTFVLCVVSLLSVNFYYAYVGDSKLTDYIRPILSKEIVRPRVKYDKDTIKSMASYINGLTKNSDKKVYIVSSSFILNDEILANSKLPQIRYAVNGLVTTNHVDRRDGFPNQFLMSDIIVVADPVQFHLKQTEQQVIGIIANSILRNSPSNLKLVKTFTLDREVKANIYYKTGAYDMAFLKNIEQEFRKSYPQYENLNSISYFFGRMQDMNTVKPAGNIYYSGKDLLLSVGSNDETSFVLKNEQEFEKLAFEAEINNKFLSKSVNLRIYDGDRLIIDDNIISKKTYNLDVSKVNRLKFVIKNADRKKDTAGIAFKKINLK